MGAPESHLLGSSQSLQTYEGQAQRAATARCGKCLRGLTAQPRMWSAQGRARLGVRAAP